MSDGKNGREVLADIRLARAGGSFDESKAVLMDGSCGLIDEIRLEGLRRATGAGLARRPPGRETGGLVNGPGDGLLGRDEAEEGPQDLERRLRPVPPVSQNRSAAARRAAASSGQEPASSMNSRLRRRPPTEKFALPDRTVRSPMKRLASSIGGRRPSPASASAGS